MWNKYDENIIFTLNGLVFESVPKMVVLLSYEPEMLTKKNLKFLPGNIFDPVLLEKMYLKKNRKKVNPQKYKY